MEAIVVRELAQKTRALKLEIAKLQNERSLTTDRARYDALPGIIARKVNELFDVCQKLRAALADLTGIPAHQIGELTQDFGYVIITDEQRRP